MYFPERLNGGLVTAIDPAELEPGELTRADNCIYMPRDTGIYRAPGQSPFGFYSSGSPASSQPINALTCIRFAGGQQYLLGQTGSELVYRDPESSGNATVLHSAYSTGTDFTSIHFKNRWYLFNGVNDNIVIKPGPIYRRHGLNPVTSPPAGSTASSSFALDTSGTYEYWYTEVAKYGDTDEVESAYVADKPTLIQVTSPTSSHAPVLTFPAQPINPETTHYRIYRSASLHVAGDAYVFPNGYQVGEISTGTTSWCDGGTPTGSSGYAASYDSDTTNPFVGSHPAGSGEFLTETAATGAANGTGSVYTNTSPGTTKNGRALMLYNFGLAPSGNILGLTVDVVAKASDVSKTTLYVSVCKRTSANVGENFPAAVGYPNGYNPRNARRALTGLSTGFTTLSAGSATDDWLPSVYDWTSDVVGSSAFAVTVWAEFAAGTPSSANVHIDSVKVTVTSNAASDQEFGKVYDYITLELDGEQIDFSAGLVPPKASCATVFQNSIVMNDVDNPRRIVWTNPGEGDSAPTDAYYLDDFGGNLSDEITYLGTASGRCVVGMSGSTWRVNYLPNENDASINRGDAVSPLSTTVGIPNSRATCNFIMADGTEGIAWANATGLYATDGLTVVPLAEGMDWAAIIGDSFNVSVIKELINDPGTETLRLLLGTGSEYCVSYARAHRTRFGGKWTGPNVKKLGLRSAACATVVHMDSGAYVPFYGLAGTASSATADIMRDDANDTGYITDIAASSGGGMVVQTRDIYPGGLDKEIDIHDVAWYGLNIDGETDSPDCDVTLYKSALREPVQTEVLEPSSSESGGKLLIASVTNGRCSGASVKFEPSTPDRIKLYSAHLRLEGFGEIDNA